MGEIYADLFTKPLKGATFLQLWGMIQGIFDSTQDVDMSCPRFMEKVTSHKWVGYNYIYICVTATATMDDHRGMCTDAHAQTHRHAEV